MVDVAEIDRQPGDDLRRFSTSRMPMDQTIRPRQYTRTED